MTEERFFLCAVVACEQTTVSVVAEETDDEWTVVDCEEHGARTRHETNPREVDPPQIMDLGWKNYLKGPRR